MKPNNKKTFSSRISVKALGHLVCIKHLYSIDAMTPPVKPAKKLHKKDVLFRSKLTPPKSRKLRSRVPNENIRPIQYFLSHHQDPAKHTCLKRVKKELHSKLGTEKVPRSEYPVINKRAQELNRGNLNLRSGKERRKTTRAVFKGVLNSIHVPKLQLDCIPSKCFQEEFMLKIEEFSESWRGAMKTGASVNSIDY